MIQSKSNTLFVAAAALGVALSGTPAAAQWEPQRTVEIIVPAGTGGGADQMARAIQGIVAKHNLMKQSMIVVNKAGGAGAEGFNDVKGSAGNPHKLIITLSNLFTTPLGTNQPFSYKDFTPVAMLALDEFVLWVNAEKPYKNVKEFLAAAKAGGFKMAGTGSRQEDQIITAAVEKIAGVKFTYVPYRGGGEVAVQLVGNHADATVNNPIEAVAHWRGGKLRPLCVFDAKPMPYNEKIAGDLAWSSIPTCKSQGLDVEYLMLRGFFMTPGATPDQVKFYVDLFQKVRATPEWKDLMNNGAFNQTFMSGKEYVEWVAREHTRHFNLMKEAGFLSTN